MMLAHHAAVVILWYIVEFYSAGAANGLGVDTRE